MNFIDIIILLLVVILSIRGYLKGFIHEIFYILIIFLGFICSFLFYEPLSSIIADYIPNRDISLLIAFISIFILITIILIVLRNTFLKLLESINFTDIDHIFGAIVGFMEGLILSGAIFVFLKNHPVLGLHEAIKKSYLISFIERVFFGIISILPDEFILVIKKILKVY